MAINGLSPSGDVDYQQDGDDEDVVSSGKSNVDKAVLSECAVDSSTGAGAVKTGCSRCARDLKMGSS